MDSVFDYLFFITFFYTKILKNCLFLAVLGLCYCTQAFSSCSIWDLLSRCDHGLPIAVTSHFGTQALELWCM